MPPAQFSRGNPLKVPRPLGLAKMNTNMTMEKVPRSGNISTYQGFSTVLSLYDALSEMCCRSHAVLEQINKDVVYEYLDGTDQKVVS